MQEYMMCSDGKKRKAVKIVCENCGKDHLFRMRTRGNPQYRFCSGLCGSEYRKKASRVELECAWCKTKFTKTPSKMTGSKSGLHFCKRKCKDEAQKIGGIKAIQPPHFGKSTRKPQKRKEKPNWGVHRRLFKPEELVCRRCGYKEFSGSVDIHHIDENHTNNNIENLMPLCSNCHRGLHHGRWKIE